MSDLDVIQAIEKQIDEPLSLCELDVVMNGNSRCRYVLNQQQVIGLNLQNCKQIDLSLLTSLENLTRLNLSLNQISLLTPLKELNKLTQLNLQKNSISDIKPLKELSCLNLLNLQDNPIIDLKPLRELKNLGILNLQANQITDIKALAELTKLVTLNLGSNSIKELAPLKHLKQLSSLNLSSNQIAGLEPLQGLTDLLELDLRFNQIAKLDALKNLKNLTQLYLSANKISELDSLKELKALTLLYLSSNQITDISPLKNLNALVELDLRSNQISQICSIENLAQLNWLYLENNQISDITALEYLTGLIQLNLRNNQITNIEALKNLKKLNQLYLSNNKIQLLPKWIIDFNLKIKWNSGGDGISVVANPLKYPPPEIIRQGNPAIKAYFEELEQQQQRPLNEAKICFIGDSGVGKTSLIKRLRQVEFDPQQQATQGIVVSDWQYQNMIVHCWDFDGRDEVQATHSLFFSEQSLYVLVLDNRPLRNEKRWLRKIEYLAGSVPILIVLNKCEQSASHDVDRKKLIESFNGLQMSSFFIVSCMQNLGLEEFKQGLITALKQIPLIRKLWPESWIQVKNTLTQQLKQQYYLPSSSYLQICQQHGVKEIVHQEQLVQMLHDLGVIVYFKKITSLEAAILEPSWMINNLYKIICSTQLRDNKGLLFLKDLVMILKPNGGGDYKYSMEHYRDIVNLMRHLELCFLLNKTHILVPQLLDTEEPEISCNFNQALNFRIHYEYLDEAIMARLIVVLRDDIADKKYWRTGMLLKNNFFNTDALVKVNYSKNTMTVQVKGEQSRNYFSVIRKALWDIEATLTAPL